MIHVQCEQCRFVNLLADEICQRCGAELKGPVPSFVRPTVEGWPRPINVESSEAGHEEFETIPAIGSFSGIGDVLSPTFQLFKNNFWLITKLVLVLVAPVEIFQTLSLGAKPSDWQSLIAIFLLAALARALVAPSLIYALVTVMRTGVAPSLNESYRWGLSRMSKLIPAVLMVWVLVALGLVCLIIPGIILSVAFQLVYPIATLEDRGPVEILKRSFQLTKGHRWNIFWAGLVLAILLGLISIPAAVVVAVLAANGITFWAIPAVLAMLSDILSEATTVLSLVIYLSIVSHAPGHIMPTTPPPPPSWE